MDLFGDLRRTGALVHLVDRVTKVEGGTALGRLDSRVSLRRVHDHGAEGGPEEAGVHLGQAVALGHSVEGVGAAFCRDACAFKVIGLDSQELAVEEEFIGGAVGPLCFEVAIKALPEVIHLGAQGAHGGVVLGPVDDWFGVEGEGNVVFQSDVAAQHHVPAGGRWQRWNDVLG